MVVYLSCGVGGGGGGGPVTGPQELGPGAGGGGGGGGGRCYGPAVIGARAACCFGVPAKSWRA